VAKQERRQHPVPLHAATLGLWRRALDEANPAPTYHSIGLNGPAPRRRLQVAYDMYVRDKSVPVSALTNTQNEKPGPFIAGQPGHDDRPSGRIRQDGGPGIQGDRAPTRKWPTAVVANMRYGLIPEGPARRAVVFGGSNIHALKPEYVDGETDEMQ